MYWNADLTYVISGVLAILMVATITGQIIRLRVSPVGAGSETVRNLNKRIRAWWAIAGVLALAVAGGWMAVLFLLGLVSLIALREFESTRADNSGNLTDYAIFTLVPLQQAFIALEWRLAFEATLPLFVFVLFLMRTRLSGARSSQREVGLIVCVYMLSHLSAVLALNRGVDRNENVVLVLFCVLVVEASDVLQYVSGKLAGRHKIAPRISPNKTWEGLIGGAAGATLLGTGMWWLTQFSLAECLFVSLTLTLAGFAGGLAMSAVKRSRGIKDFGTLVAGHGGVLDRVDSLAFAAPVFYYLTLLLTGASVAPLGHL